eukprot:TRINITY_DN7847_c0_g4_i2.p1 TRINITY_DN7847_c0_g4~~TRINITY_DN7847_c0_g4_i2.p1  ORF type:complete len:679 (-),score=69.11 TRINITY_DN7847_c0_g4_i2:47-1795(-)
MASFVALFLCLVVQFVATSSLGYIIEYPSDLLLWPIMLAYFSWILASATILRTTRIAFGNPCLTPDQMIVDTLFGIILIVQPATHMEPSWRSGLSCLLVCPVILRIATRGRCFAVLGFVFSLLLYSMSMLSKGHFVLSVAVVPSLLMGIAASAVEYRRDQVILQANAIMQLLHFMGGASLAFGGVNWIFLGVVDAVTMLTFFLWCRRVRRLPGDLTDIRFIRLGYLRQMLLEGKPIVRMQDMPSAAFGAAEKADQIICISHRWLDRNRCDAATAAFPGGLRLTTMLDKLDHYFRPSCIKEGKSFKLLCRAALDYKSLGGSDILIFFDFMCLPQIGADAEGKEVPRTTAEDELFQRLLPSMGSLYSFNPVMILPEVANDLHSYDSSGWCFSEMCTAALGKQLDKYSQEWQQLATAQLKAIFEIAHRDTIDSSSIDSFVDLVNREFRVRRFREDADRFVVRDMIVGFLLKRRLVDAVRANDVVFMKAILSNLPRDRVEQLIADVIDSKLNTLLHCAAEAGAVDTAKALLDLGASASCRNSRGDTPMQWYMAPRLNAAARLCRSYSKMVEGNRPPAASSIGRASL